MKKSDFTYNLPEELIAQRPSEKRDMSRLMVLDPVENTIEHKVFHEIEDYLKEGDCLVVNDTRVIPARMYGKRKDTGGNIEIVLLKNLDDNRWEVLTKPGRRATPGRRFVFGNGELEAIVKEIVEDGNRIVEFVYEGIFEEVLDKVGVVPLPPYINETPDDMERYQTVYSKIKGSSAAPTAGLHFTEELLERIKSKGVTVAKVTLHIGLGTFRPVKSDNILDHIMHSEYYEISTETADIINETKRQGGRVISVGTTSTRVLESVADDSGVLKAGCGETDIFIYPGYGFKCIDGLITNFHLPESTLMMLVSALAGREFILKAYEEAVAQRYRFFSFGDAMFIKRRKV
ncbi:MAG: tRNA preQ1(34) S-adenosylmethionine ribosyltransferase-isomerase QueA [Clostridia bacterium]|nr:tRNA preQ1(34) S-adenosylmethionine ribosyltransferase-isomerase QueA [Clostridia bacterium]MBN2883995.1 tRNA preQ1(34) S-adenosylmethionine ribosyltransferase-isomerase QueA [Clostridia bacterium]